MDNTFVKEVNFALNYDLKPRFEQLVMDSFNRCVARFATWPNARDIHAEWEEEILAFLDTKKINLKPSVIESMGMRYIVSVENDETIGTTAL